jgi:hypothetical protein
MAPTKNGADYRVVLYLNLKKKYATETRQEFKFDW